MQAGEMLKLTAVWLVCHWAIQKRITEQRGHHLIHFLPWGRRENFVAQILNGKLMFSWCRVLTKAWSDMNICPWKRGQEERKKSKNHIELYPFVIWHTKNATEGHCRLKMALLDCFSLRLQNLKQARDLESSFCFLGCVFCLTVCCHLCTAFLLALVITQAKRQRNAIHVVQNVSISWEGGNKVPNLSQKSSETALLVTLKHQFHITLNSCSVHAAGQGTQHLVALGCTRMPCSKITSCIWLGRKKQDIKNLQLHQVKHSNVIKDLRRIAGFFLCMFLLSDTSECSWAEKKSHKKEVTSGRQQRLRLQMMMLLWKMKGAASCSPRGKAGVVCSSKSLLNRGWFGSHWRNGNSG